MTAVADTTAEPAPKKRNGTAQPFSAFERLVAWRYLRPRRKEAAVSIVTIISLVGVTLGVAALIIVMAVMNGFRAELLDRILGLNGHMVISAIDSPLTDYERVSANVVKVPGVNMAIPIVEGQALATGNVGAGSGVLVRGIRGEDFAKLDQISGNIKEGSLEAYLTGDGVAIGSRMAVELGLIPGDLIKIISPEGDVTPFGTTPRVKSYPVRAVFEMGMSEYDRSIIIMPLEEAQLYFNQEGEAQVIEVFVDDPDAVDSYKPEIEKAADRPVFISDWRQRNQAFFSALIIERNAMFLILSIVVVVASLNIISSLIMMVKEKARGVAILRTMGATQSSIMRIFIMAGIGVGFVGTLTGFILGLLVCLNIRGIQRLMNWMAGADVWDPTIRFLSEIPAKINPWETLSVVILSLTLSLLAAILPAWRAARLDPVEALIRVMADTTPVLRLQGVSRAYQEATRKLEILKNADFELKTGEMVALVAPSGAGKSTLLHVAGLLERPDDGEVYIAGTGCGGMGDADRTARRRNDIGFVYQFHHLLPEFSALENVMIPQMIRGLPKTEAADRARQLLDYLRIGPRADHRPAELSGGEQQRVAIARAVANAPLVLLADEPTGNLDPETSGYVFDALAALARQSGLSALVATHNHALAERMDRVVTLQDGRIVPFAG